MAKFETTVFLKEGDAYGHLTVLRELECRLRKNGKKDRMFLCKCVCGKEYGVMMNNLRSRKNISCGCMGNYGANFYKHGLCHHPLFGRWSGMLARCYNENFKYYSMYGGRGITVCDEWRNDFKPFYDWAICNGFREDLELDRYPDNDGNYEPSNCRWTTGQENCSNTRRNKYYLFNGKMLTLSQISRLVGIDKDTLYVRINYYKIPFADAVINNDRRRSAFGKRKLTDEQVLQIFSSKESTKTLRLRYDISESTVRQIRAKRTWKHLHTNP